MFSTFSYPFNSRDFLFFDKTCSKSSAAESSYEGKGYSIFYKKCSAVNGFPGDMQRISADDFTKPGHKRF